MNKLYSYLALCVTIVTLNACSKQLSAPPENAKVEDNTILDQSTAQIALNGVYYTFANATATKNGWQVHQIIPAELTGYMEYGYGPGGYDNNDNSEVTLPFWNEEYVLINAANGLINGVEALPDIKFTNGRKAQMLGEARFLRAYGHYRILTYYAQWYDISSKYGVLLRDELSNLGNIPKARSTVKDSYDFILADLDTAIADGPSTNPNYYATRWAAMVLKMRVLMMRGGSGDYATVIQLADSVILNSSYTLEANAVDIFHTKGLSSKEVILGLVPQALQTADYYSKSAQYYPGASALYVATSALKTLYANDPRLAWMVGAANPSSSSPNSFYFTKFFVPGSAVSTVSETDYAIRLTEVYLLKAEAIVRSGGNLADARTLLHTIQSKASITATTNNTNYLAVEGAITSDSLLIETYKEEARSLVGEDGLEWMALLRLPLATVEQIKPTITNQAQYIFGIPHEEFLYNPIIGDQNPGYNK